MNFYSIFRIVRLICKDIFGRKVWRIILILGIVLILYLVLTNKTFAYTVPDSSQENGTSYNIYSSELQAQIAESSYQASLIEAIESFGEYDEKFETGNYLGYIGYLLKNYGSAVNIFAYPGTFNQNFGGTYSYSTTTMTVIVYTSCLKTTASVSQWQDIQNLSVGSIYATATAFDTNLYWVYYYTYTVKTGADYASGACTSSNSRYAYIPSCLFQYRSSYLDNYVLGDTTTNSDIVNAIESSTDEITSAQQDTTDAINSLNDNLMSTDYDEEQAGNTLNSISGSTDDVDDSETKGLFTTIFNKLSSCINGDYETVETIDFDVMGHGTISLSSDILSSQIKDTVLYTLLQAGWTFVFGLYLFKFVNNLYNKIKSGDILNGYENNDEVITSTML